MMTNLIFIQIKYKIQNVIYILHKIINIVYGELVQIFKKF